jgi:Tol biopolymer transport system component
MAVACPRIHGLRLTGRRRRRLSRSYLAAGGVFSLATACYSRRRVARSVWVGFRSSRTFVVVGVLVAAVLTSPGAESRLLKPLESASFFGPTWSPDGRRLAFLERRPDGAVLLRVANAAGTTSRVVTGAREIAEVRWAPRRNVLAYSWSYAYAQPPPYYVAVVEAGRARGGSLTPGIGAFGVDIDWAPDGKGLAFVGPLLGREFVGPLAGGAIWTITLDGRLRMRLTQHEYNRDPAWGPDGRAIAFTRRLNRDGGEQVYLARSVGGRLRPLAFRHSCCPSWSPDGSRLVFIGRPRADSDRTALFVIRRDGRGERRITPSYPPEQAFRSPEWSPRGTQILFVRSTVPGQYSVGIARPDGRIRYLGRGHEGEWSPNGRAIAFTDNCADGASAVFVMNANGSGRRSITPCSRGSLAAHPSSVRHRPRG